MNPTTIVTMFVVLLSTLPLALGLPEGAENLLITQVLYNPLEESGSEAVEIFNPNTFDVDISGLVIGSESQAEDATLPNQSVIRAESYFLVADTDFSTKKDNPSWPDADYEETLSLYNTDSGVNIQIDNTIIDAVGWGNPLDIGAEFYEETPANDTDNGESLERVSVDGIYQDTDNNAHDFSVQTSPLIHTATEYVPPPENATVIEVTATVTGILYRVIETRLLQDDSLDDGYQILPLPGTMRTITVEADIEKPADIPNVDITATLNQVSVPMQNSQNLSKTEQVYQANVEMEYYDLPGIYEINISFSDPLSVPGHINFTYLEALALELDTTTIEFNLETGETQDILGDENSGTTDAPTIRNIGNVPLDPGISFTGLQSDSATIDPSSLLFSFYADIFSGSLGGPLSSEIRWIDLSLAPSASALNALSFSLAIPESAVIGEYTGQVYIYAGTS